jgi:hypothetical protein
LLLRIRPLLKFRCRGREAPENAEMFLQTIPHISITDNRDEQIR